jgi:hypothetical protein
MKRTLFAFALSALTTIGPAAASTLTATFVKGQLLIPSGASIPGAEYDSASVTLSIDPTITNWIAWNNASSLLIPRVACSGGFCLGPGGFGTDDFIALTVTNPLNTVLTVNLDQNNDFGNSFGFQNVIFGAAADAPDALRTLNPFSTPSEQIFDQAGSHNAIFTIAGDYVFRFSWRNSACCTAGHQATWLLVDTDDVSPVPLPAALPLFATGLGVVMLLARRKRSKSQATA